MKWDRAPAGPDRGRDSPDDVAPSGWGRWREVAWHLPRLLSGLGPLGPRGPEDGPPALVIPGFLATDRTTMELRRALARAGWRSHPWLLGMNSGAKANTMDLLAKPLDAIYDGARPVLVVGWSLGGMFARELACRCPDKIRAVVTLGSPSAATSRPTPMSANSTSGSPATTSTCPPFERFGGKPPVPTLALWSRKDGIVAPAAARGLAHEVDKAVEIDTHHMGFAVYRPALSKVVSEISGVPDRRQVEGAAPTTGEARAAA